MLSANMTNRTIMNHKIELINVNYVYGAGSPFETVALENIDLKIETGKITGIYEHGCDLFRKRMECAIMLEALKAVEG